LYLRHPPNRGAHIGSGRKLGSCLHQCYPTHSESHSFPFESGLGRAYAFAMSRHAVLITLLLLAAPLRAETVADCLVTAKQTARVGAAVKGVIARIAVDRADRVVQGQVLAELESSAEERQIALARLRAGSDIAERLAQRKAETAELKVARFSQLGDSRLISRTELEAAELEARIARLEEEEARLARRIAAEELKAAEAARERKRVRAPFSGVVTARMMAEGELYNEQGPILVLARIDPLLVEAYLPAEHRADIAPGMAARVALETGGTVTARVDLVDPVLDAATGTFGLRLALPNPDGAILAGQSCSLRLGRTAD